MYSRISWLIPIVILTVLFVSIGCSGGPKGNSPISPALSGVADGERAGSESARHALLGLYTFTVNPDRTGIEVVPLRNSTFHLNALRFLEPPPPVRIKLSNFQYDGKKIDVDIQLLHPFPGLPQFTGFDVCGILISSGSISGFSDPDLVVAGEGDTRLVNPDGLTRWWNPREFPINTSVKMWGYIDGGWGIKDGVAHYTATLNGYKYHADGLSQFNDLSALDPAMRGAFTVGAGHTRHYTIELDAGMVFNYAIDAAWLPPTEKPVIVPDSFPPEANRAEPFRIEVEVTDNSLYFDESTGLSGGKLGLDVHCYDWFNVEQDKVHVESPGIFDPTTSVTPFFVDGIHGTWHVDMTNPTLTSADPIPIWVSAESEVDWDGFLPGKFATMYLPPINVDVQESIVQDDLILVWTDEQYIDHTGRVGNNDIEPALIIDGNDDLLLSFSYYVDYGSGYINYARYATSTNFGHSFGNVIMGGWNSHSGPYSNGLIYNNKYCVAANGRAFQSYECPAGHALGATPTYGETEYIKTRSHSGTAIKHAGEMMYTIDGYPIMFGDAAGVIRARLGSYPNEGGTQTWPTFQGTYLTLVQEAQQNWLSIARSEGKTSDGICHLIFWQDGLPYIRMISTTDTSGANWDVPATVFDGTAETWVGASDPSLWIDDDDGFHTLFAAEDWMGNYHLMYGYSATGDSWNDGTSFKDIMQVPIADGLNDTVVTVFDAFGFTWVFLTYETGGNVYCRYKKITASIFSDPIQVNVQPNAALPDIYWNGDRGACFAYQADDGSGSGQTDIFYRVAEFKLD